MSAIIGVHFPDGRPVECSLLERMVQSVAHRGPDDIGIWYEASTGLGQGMLRTPPEAFHERLPLVGPTGDLVLIADARIDNRAELMTMLGMAGHAASKIGDSELILAAYERWGERCPTQLIGDYAFAIWDGRRQHLFLARDAMGVRPLYYALGSKTKATGRPWGCKSGAAAR